MEKEPRASLMSGRLSVVFVAFLAVLICGLSVGEQVEQVDGVVAVVNDRVILRSEVGAAAAAEFRRLAQAYSGKELQTRTEEVYRKAQLALVERNIILAACENPNPEAVDQMVMERLEAVVQATFKGDRSAFLDALAAEHLTLQEWKDDVRDSILVSTFKQREVDSKAQVSPGAVRREYDADREKYKAVDSVKLRIISVHNGKTGDAAIEARKQADELRQKAAGGGDFVSLQKSVDPDEKGGEPEWVGPADLRPEVAAIVMEMKAGEISPVVEIGDLFLILKVEARRAGKPVTFEEARVEIERRLKQKEQSRIYGLWIENLRRQVHVKVIQPEMVLK